LKQLVLLIGVNNVVRVNLIEPAKLADQHLIAEYNEILMLVAFIKKHSSLENIPDAYCLGKGHMSFFKDKLIYLKNRHDLLKLEMKKRNFKTDKTLMINGLPEKNKQDWVPDVNGLRLIKERIKEKLNKKPEFYRYYGEYKSTDFFINLLK